MELELKNGRYVTADGAPATVSGAEELRQRILMKLCARRGSFLPLPEYGSRLHLLQRCKAAQREAAARQYIAEALEGEDAELEKLAVAQRGDRLFLDMVFRTQDDSIRLEMTI